MAKLTAAQARAIETVLYHLNRAEAFLADDDVRVCRAKDMATTTLDFMLPDGKAASEINKDYGSDLTGLSMARQYLVNFYDMNIKV